MPLLSFAARSPLTVREDDGVIVYGRRLAVMPTAPARPSWQATWQTRVLKDLNRLARLINGPPEPAGRREVPFYHGHASGLRIAGIACIHRAPLP